ncbi:hypothetical protein Tco_0745818 [Tanacetum coccineum]
MAPEFWCQTTPTEFWCHGISGAKLHFADVASLLEFGTKSLAPRLPVLLLSHIFLPSQPQTYHTAIMVKIVPYEAFVCPCGSGDVVLRESYKPKTQGKLYYACPRSKPRENTFGCKKFLWKEKRVRLLVGSPGASTTPIYYPGSSSTPVYSSGSSSTPIYSRNAECSNCKHLLDKITVLEATVDMYMHPEQHTVNSALLFHEVYNNMGKLDLE